jgi:cytoskeletal protein RodZ
MAEKSSLQQAREVAGLSVEQIASLTNIRPAVIRDLENNLVEVCGGIAYARGHIRSIVKVINQKTPKSINIDADLLVAEMEQNQDQDNRTMINRLAENNVAEKPKERKRMKFGTLASISITALTLTFVAQIAIDNASSVKSELNSESSKVASVEQELPVQVSGVNLVVTGVSGKSWVGLTTTDGEQIFNGQISAGQVATFSDPNLIRAVIGNAGAVKLILNGKDLGVPGAQGEVIRLDFDANGQL